jgi:hypothetical protein
MTFGLIAEAVSWVVGEARVILLEHALAVDFIKLGAASIVARGRAKHRD